MIAPPEVSRAVEADAGDSRSPGDHAWEAARIELDRLTLIYLRIDRCPLGEGSVRDTVRLLETVRESLAPWQDRLARVDRPVADDLERGFERAIQAAEAAVHEPFDRMGMLTDRLLPLAHAVGRARSTLGILILAHANAGSRSDGRRPCR